MNRLNSVFLFLLSCINIYAQSVTVDFSKVEISPPQIPGYSGTIIVDSQLKSIYIVPRLKTMSVRHRIAKSLMVLWC